MILCIKQLVQIIVRYVIALSVALLVGSVTHFFIFNTVSGSFLAKTMALSLFIVMIPSVFLWHIVAQFFPIICHKRRHLELNSALIAALLTLAGVDALLPELTSSAAIDIALFVGTLSVAAGLCGCVMDWLKTKEWILCRFIVT